MDISTLSSWLGVISGIGFCATTIWATFRWFRASLAKTNEAAVVGKQLADELLNHATSATRRADIHTFILFIGIEMEGERGRRLILDLFGGLALLATGLAIAVIHRTFEVDSQPWLWHSLIATYLISVASYLATLFLSHQLWRIQSGWHSSVKSVLQDKAFKHATRE